MQGDSGGTRGTVRLICVNPDNLRDGTERATSGSKVKGRLLQENRWFCKDNFGEVKIASIKHENVFSFIP